MNLNNLSFFVAVFNLLHWTVTAGSAGECLPAASDLSRYICFGGGDNNDARTCQDDHEECENWAKRGECGQNPHYMLANCRKSCETCVDGHVGVTQIVPSEELASRVYERLRETQEYFQKETETNVEYWKLCENKHELCTYYAVQGDCEANSDWMQQNCAPACKSCHLVKR